MLVNTKDNEYVEQWELSFPDSMGINWYNLIEKLVLSITMDIHTLYLSNFTHRYILSINYYKCI